MRVSINCLSLDPSYVGGLNTFTIGLLEGFASVANGHQFRVFCTDRNKTLFEGLSNDKSFELIELDGRTVALQKYLRRAALCTCSESAYELASNRLFRAIRDWMEEGADVVYTPSTVLQGFDNRKPSVLSMHDIQHVHYPEFFNWPQRLSRRITYGLSARRAGFFQASSEFIKQDLLKHFHCITAQQIEVIPEGVNVERFGAPVDASSLLAKYKLPEHFLFYPAQLWPHKNHMTLLRALKHIEGRHGFKIPLVLTGGKYTATPKIMGFVREQSMNHVHYLGRVPLDVLVALHQKAEFLVIPSLHESSSLPILEAAAAGTPVIASRIPANEEVAGVLQLNLFQPLEPEALARLIFKLWRDNSVARAQAEYNRSQIAFFSWQNAARKFLAWFTSVA